MKKRLFVLILVIAALAVLVSVAAACGNAEGNTPQPSEPGEVTVPGDNESDEDETPVCVHSYEAVWSWTGTESASVILTCSKCNDTVTETAEITSEVTTAATCTEAGETTYTAIVTYDGNEYTDTKTETIPALGHSYGNAVWSWTGTESANVTLTCSKCSDTVTETAEITSEVTTAATCTEAGETTYTAKVTYGSEEYTDTKTEAIPALGHAYGNAVWSWTGTESASVTLTCSKCSDTVTETAAITSEVTTAATCTEAGETTYTAKATYEGVEYTDTKIVTVQPLGHTWSEKYSYDDNGHWRTCSVCGSEEEHSAHTGGAATCTAQAVCEVCSAPYGELAAHTPGAWQSDENEHWQNCSVCNTEIAGTRVAHEYESVYTPSEVPEQNGTFSKKCSVCDKVSGFINVGGSISVTYYASADDETGITVDFTPYSCYDEDKSAYGVTYDAVKGRFVINLNSVTESAYYANGLKVTQSGGSIGKGDMSVYIHEDVTINSIEVTGGWVNFYIEGSGKLTINGEFRSAENPVISNADVIIKGNVTMPNQKLTVSGGSIESGAVNVDTLVLTDGKMTVNGTLTLKVLTVGAEGSDSAPVLEVTVDGDMNGINNSGSLDVDIYGGSVVVSNAQKAYSGISSNNAWDSIVVHGGSLTVNGFGVPLAFWNGSSEDVCAIEVLGGKITLSGYGENAINNIQTSEDVNGVVNETDTDGIKVTTIKPKA